MRQLKFRGRATKLGALVVVFVCVVLAAPVFAFVARSTHGMWVPKLAKGAVTARCPSGTNVAFGGMVAQFDFAHDAVVVPTGMRRTANGLWSVYGQSASTSRGSRLTAVGYCDHGVPPVAREKTVSVAHAHVGSAVAKCPAGTVVVAGGFNTRAFPHLAIMKALERVADDSWRATILNAGDGPTTITAIAYCGPGPAPTPVETTISVRGGTGGTARATCPAGTALVFGGERVTVGFSDDLPHVIPFSFTAESKTRWAVAALNAGFARGSLTSIAYCR